MFALAWPKRPFPYLAAALMGTAVWKLGYQTAQSEFHLIAPLFAALFLIYGAIWKQAQEEEVAFFTLLGWLLRLLLLFSIPNLSDDIYRFVWDGRLLLQGFNPFDHLPSYYAENGFPPGLDQSLYDRLNSPGYFTVYPPVAQFTFATACWLFPNSILGSSAIMKLFVLAFETGTLVLLPKLLRHWQFPRRNVLLYALNPLLIVELTGNLHFEAGMIFFLLLGLWWIVREKWTSSAAAMALAVASKLLPLLFLPLLIRRLGWNRSLRYLAVVGLLLLALFLPLLNGAFWGNFGSSLNLYFQKFEFNASVYYLLRWVGHQITGYNLIHQLGPILATGTLLTILAMTAFEEHPRWRNLPAQMLFAICTYLALTTTVHPWYASLPVLFSLFTRYRFPLLWSYLITWTYINYSYPEYQENLWVVVAEYALVLGFFLYERFAQPLTKGKVV